APGSSLYWTGLQARIRVSHLLIVAVGAVAGPIVDAGEAGPIPALQLVGKAVGAHEGDECRKLSVLGMRDFRNVGKYAGLARTGIVLPQHLEAPKGGRR